MRMIRDSPPELARLCAAPWASISTTDWPVRRSSYAIQAPKTPAPTTAQSYVSGKREAPLRFECSLVHQMRRGQIFDRQSQRFENHHLVERGTTQCGIAHHLAQFSGDVVSGEASFFDTEQHVP